MIHIKQQCQNLAQTLEYTGDVEDDNALMNYLLCYCLKRTLQTRWMDYLRVWKSLRMWESGTMTYGDLAQNLAAIISIDTAYKGQHQGQQQ